MFSSVGMGHRPLGLQLERMCTKSNDDVPHKNGLIMIQSLLISLVIILFSFGLDD